MSENPEICLCFHVRIQKIRNWIRIEKPSRVGQLSDCYGAGTGCGWCRPILQRLFDEGQSKAIVEMESLTDHVQGRSEYIRQGKGKPPHGE